MGDQDRGAPAASPPGRARRSPPRRARRARRSARRAAPARPPGGSRRAPGPARPAATAHRRDRCRPHSPSPAACRGRRGRRPRRRPAPPGSSASGAPSGRDIVAQGEVEADEVLEDGGDLRAPGVDVEVAQVDAVDLDRAGGRVVEAAEQLGQRGLARAVLPDDRERRPGRDGEVEARRDRPRRCADRRSSGRGSGSRRRGSAVGRVRSPPARRRPGPSRASVAARRPPARRRRPAPSSARRRRSCSRRRRAARRPPAGRATGRRRGGRSPGPEDQPVADRTSASAPAPTAPAAGWRCTAARRAAAGARGTARWSTPPGRTGAVPSRRAGPPPGDRRSRRGAAPTRTSSVLRSRQTPLSRSSQWVEPATRPQHRRRPPGEAEEHERRGDPADQPDQAAGDEVDVHEHRRPGHAPVELAGDGEVVDQVGILQMADAGRLDASCGELVVEPGGDPARGSR